MLQLRFPYTTYRKESSPSRPLGPTLRARLVQVQTRVPPQLCRAQAATRSHALNPGGQAVGLQLRTFCSDSHRGSVPRLLCLLGTGGLPTAIRVHILPGSPPAGKRKKKEKKNALPTWDANHSSWYCAAPAQPRVQ